MRDRLFQRCRGGGGGGGGGGWRGSWVYKVFNCRQDSVCEHPRKWTLQTDGGDGGWWRWWRMMEMMKVCRTLCLIKFHLHTPFTLTSLSNVWCFCSSRKIFTSKFVSFCDQILPFWFPDLNEPLWKVSSLPSVHSERIWTIIYISVIRLLASSWHRGASSTLTNLYKTLPCRTSAVGCRVFLSPEVSF